MTMLGQPPNVPSEGFDRAVGRHEQGEDIEAVEALPRLEPRVGACCLLYEREGVRAVPRMTVDARTAVGIKRSAQTKEAVLPPRCAHPLRASHAHDAVAGNTLASNHRGR